MSESPYDVSISRLFADLKAGRSEAADELWRLYFDRLVKVAKRRLAKVPKRVSDEEDVAVSVFKSLCAGAVRGRFAEHVRRDDLWRLRLHLTRQKSVDYIREQTRKKTGRRSGARRIGLSQGRDQFLDRREVAIKLLRYDHAASVMFNNVPRRRVQPLLAAPRLPRMRRVRSSPSLR